MMLEYLRTALLVMLLRIINLNLSAAGPFPGGCVDMPYGIVADDAFPLSPNIMKPFSQRWLSHERRVFNYRLSWARRIVENIFGNLGGDHASGRSMEIRNEFMSYFSGEGEWSDRNKGTPQDVRCSMLTLHCVTRINRLWDSAVIGVDTLALVITPRFIHLQAGSVGGAAGTLTSPLSKGYRGAYLSLLAPSSSFSGTKKILVGLGIGHPALRPPPLRICGLQRTIRGERRSGEGSCERMWCDELIPPEPSSAPVKGRGKVFVREEPGWRTPISFPRRDENTISCVGRRSEQDRELSATLLPFAFTHFPTPRLLACLPAFAYSSLSDGTLQREPAPIRSRVAPRSLARTPYPICEIRNRISPPLHILAKAPSDGLPHLSELMELSLLTTACAQLAK
ncbi:hypothetical protein PR048_025357 [Dryococelus australis]|uniref:DDE Tnp4 domain-containing protein n=1 Tax=Dryococelus australis TaxID=614101 RepID=A0ABQ9GR40_9NEOP|nr:hypothetical protein PR048_025357 [Dryococelus australis]